MERKERRMRYLALIGVLAALVSTQHASAQACPASTDYMEMYHLTLSDGTAVNMSGLNNLRFQMIDIEVPFFGTVSFVGARPETVDGYRTPMFFTNSRGQWITELPKAAGICLGAGNDIVQISSNFNYNGYPLYIYGQGGSDRIWNGDGYDVQYGGDGDDNLGTWNRFTPGTTLALGQGNNDRIFTGSGSYQLLDGGDGVDIVMDNGGSGEMVFGGNGDDSCVADLNAGAGGGLFDCGAGRDTYNTNPGYHTLACEVKSSCWL